MSFSIATFERIRNGIRPFYNIIFLKIICVNTS